VDWISRESEYTQNCLLFVQLIPIQIIDVTDG